MSTKSKTKISKLCEAIHRVRVQTKMTQPQFAAALRTATMTLSRWERGVNQPRDVHVLQQLAIIAAGVGLRDEEALFCQASGTLPARQVTPTQIWPGPISYLTLDFDTPQQWRLMIAAKLAVMYFPETATAMEQAAGHVQALVDEVISTAPENLRPDFYVRMEQRLNEVARRQAFVNLKKGIQQ